MPATITNPEPASPNQPPASLPAGQRIASIDAYRGFVMFLMMGEVLNFCKVATATHGNPFWTFLCHHQSHVDWIGCSLHDLIQPSFSFLVGTALPFSIASRLARGQSRLQLATHAFLRAFALAALGILLRSIGRPQLNFTFEDTLTQIGLGYGFLFLLGLRPARDQWIALILILVGYWGAFALYPVTTLGSDLEKVGVPAAWPHLLGGFSAHWQKNANFAWAFDTWFMNLFPRQKPFLYNGGGYSTLSFIPTLGTMILGLVAGNLLKRQDLPPARKATWLLKAGLISLSAGYCLGALGLCPVVKRIWTPSWTLFSAGWAFLLLAGFYTIIDIRRWHTWAFPLRVIGMNSIAAYCIAHLWDHFISSMLHTIFGVRTFQILGTEYEPFIHGAAVLLCFWLVLLWMHRRKLYLRI